MRWAQKFFGNSTETIMKEIFVYSVSFFQKRTKFNQCPLSERADKANESWHHKLSCFTKFILIANPVLSFNSTNKPKNVPLPIAGVK